MSISLDRNSSWRLGPTIDTTVNNLEGIRILSTSTDSGYSIKRFRVANFERFRISRHSRRNTFSLHKAMYYSLFIY